MTADHAPYDELAVGWALHALEPEDEARFAAHLPGCERCAATVAETSEVMSAMATDLPQPEPSEGLRNRIRAAVARTEQMPQPIAAPSMSAGAPVRPVPLPPEPRRTVEVHSRRRRALLTGLVAAALAAIVGLGLRDVVLTADREELRSTVAEQSEIMDGLMTPGQAIIAPLAESGGRPVATIVARGDEVQVITHGLPINDARATSYVLWGMGGGTAQPLGTFDVTRSQIDTRTVGSGLTGFDQYAAYGISLEPGQKAPSLPTEVVATGQVTS